MPRDNRAMAGPPIQIESLTPAQAHERQRAGATLVDVRESHERAVGRAAGALGVSRGELEADPAVIFAHAIEDERDAISSGGFRGHTTIEELEPRIAA